MPQIQLHPALRFTDHYIRVVRNTDYPVNSIVQRVRSSSGTPNQ
jgi:hypothetical protein